MKGNKFVIATNNWPGESIVYLAYDGKWTDNLTHVMMAPNRRMITQMLHRQKWFETFNKENPHYMAIRIVIQEA